VFFDVFPQSEQDPEKILPKYCLGAEEDICTTTLPKCGIQEMRHTRTSAAGVLTTLTTNPRVRYRAEKTYTPNPTANLNANL